MLKISKNKPPIFQYTSQNSKRKMFCSLAKCKIKPLIQDILLTSSLEHPELSVNLTCWKMTRIQEMGEYFLHSGV